MHIMEPDPPKRKRGCFGKFLKEEFVRTEDDKILRRVYSNKTGKILSETHYENDMKNGLSTFFFDNGAIQNTRYYVNDLLHGQKNDYLITGEVWRTIEYVNGVLHGKYWVKYNGETLEEYKNGIKVNK